MSEIVDLAINDIFDGNQGFCKFLTANDSGETGGHQSGILISNKALEFCFGVDDEVRQTAIYKKSINVTWQNDFATSSVFTWYKSKGEMRITQFGRGFPFIKPEYTGALFVLIKHNVDEYSGYFFNTDDEIRQFLDAFALTPADTNNIINSVSAEVRERAVIREYITANFNMSFPPSETMSAAARMISYQLGMAQKLLITNPDKALITWTNKEYKLFQALEDICYGDKVRNGFATVEEFVSVANQVLNRRKSRAGKSLEHHLASIFDANNIKYTAQAITEGNKKPDFIFPSEESYHDMTFSVDKLCSLAAKTTCKDRWRQVLNEADRLRDHNKYLCTLQQGISSAQMDEMQAERVILVVPKQFISTYPNDKQDRIWTIGKFVSYIREIEGLG